MYRYDEFDHGFVTERARQFRGQVARRLVGDLTEEQFKPLRLQNGLYLQLHAYMLRIAIPYGVLSSRKLRQLALIARKWDRGYGHFTTRQNIQFHWIRLEDTPDILDALAEVGHRLEAVGVADAAHAVAELAQLLEVGRGERHAQRFELLPAVAEERRDEVFQILGDLDLIGAVAHDPIIGVAPRGRVRLCQPARRARAADADAA